ncbi:hypothetical protein AOQ72_16805 [Bradyrhizobium yuanmingense]|uniref:Uncharacterized protein n=1 Tax=Bradyrhizobium yuanmingense TaxID=108015 RepID=A0A0R3CM20_9BRAD|nr:hypothetical protein AOQ72_16805 [Bradyrhizobium yuanmingense]
MRRGTEGSFHIGLDHVFCLQPSEIGLQAMVCGLIVKGTGRVLMLILQEAGTDTGRRTALVAAFRGHCDGVIAMLVHKTQ